MNPPVKDNKKKYEVEVEMMFGSYKKTNYKVVVGQDKLDEMIGRFTRKHGPPINMSHLKEEYVLNFYSRVEETSNEVVLYFKLAEDATPLSTGIKIIKTEPPVELIERTVVPPAPPKVENEKITKLLEANVLCKGY